MLIYLKKKSFFKWRKLRKIHKTTTLLDRVALVVSVSNKMQNIITLLPGKLSHKIKWLLKTESKHLSNIWTNKPEYDSQQRRRENKCVNEWQHHPLSSLSSLPGDHLSSCTCKSYKWTIGSRFTSRANLNPVAWKRSRSVYFTQHLLSA